MPANYHFHEDQSLRPTDTSVKGWLTDIPEKATALLKGLSSYHGGGISAAAKEAVVPLDIDDPMSKRITKEMVSMLWGSMLHPPQSFRGEKYQYRTADGSNHNAMYPWLGQAGTPYAKSVQGSTAQKGARPQPEDLFDLLMARPNGDHNESDTGISSMLLYQATIVIHDVFRSNDYDKNISDTSSYLDLAPLYGKDQEAQDTVRTFREGYLKPDTFAEHRLLNQPPAVSIFLIMYNRFHNYVAERLLQINEGDRFSLPANYRDLSPEEQGQARKEQDQELFQVARLVTCGLYAQIAVHDYLRTLMGIHAKDSPWTLDPRTSFPEGYDKRGLQRGEGNMVSVEFNLLYRFHSPLSERDCDWSTELFKMWLSMGVKAGATPEEIQAGTYITPEMLQNEEIPVPFMQKLIAMQNAKAARDTNALRESPYFPPGFDRVGGPKGAFVFTRNQDGKFDDKQLVAELIRASEDPICSFGAQGIPKIFKSVEMIGILQARKWEVASLNEFRAFFGMERHKSFEDINSDPYLQQTLRDLYDDVDQVELYPGFVVEGQGRACDPNNSCGSGAGTALWRGIFSDAVTLVRSDRFYTLDWNVDSLTTWGMKELTSDPKINKGGMMYKLYHHAFPGFFHYNALQLWQPYHTPASNLILAQEQGHLHKLNIDGYEYRFDNDDKDVWRPLDTRRLADGKYATDFKKLSSIDKSLRVDQIDGKRKERCHKMKILGARFAKGEITKQEYYTQRNAMKPVPMFRLRRQLERASGYENSDLRWARGRELAKPISRVPQEEDSYDIIRSTILGRKECANWLNRDVGSDNDIPAGALREVMLNKFDKWEEAVAILEEHLMGGQEQEQVLREYLDELAQQMRLREERDYNVPNRSGTSKVYQLDVVRDFAIPFIVRFVADVLGFWEKVKTPEFPDRDHDENEIYRHIVNCQNWRSWNADQTKMMQRREAFQKSSAKLKELAEFGVSRWTAGIFNFYGYGRSYGSKGDGSKIHALRISAVRAIQALLAKFEPDVVAAIMLSNVLTMTNTAVIRFTEILAYFLQPEGESGEQECSHTPHTKLWEALQGLANVGDPVKALEAAREIDGYVLEAWRLGTTLKPAFRYNPKEAGDIAQLSSGKSRNKDGDIEQDKLGNSVIGPRVAEKGDLVVLNLRKAMQDSKVFDHPASFNPKRTRTDYLLFGRFDSKEKVMKEPSVAMAMTIVVQSAMLKHMARLMNIRPAHGRAGRLRTLIEKDHRSEVERVMYLNSQWNELTPWPATWTLRYDGEGKGVWEPPAKRFGLSDGMVKLTGEMLDSMLEEAAKRTGAPK
ncbi:heme peroxidase [Xylariaceae sp. FL1272]|nr:heme peroxidase [Xylariaceae sp. FL1272]